MAFQLHVRMSGGSWPMPSGRPSFVGDQRICRVSVYATASYGNSSTSSTTATATTNDSLLSEAAAGAIRVKVSATRPTSLPPPSPPSLIHSPVYVQKALIKPPTDAGSSLTTSQKDIDPADDEQVGSERNGLVWALKQVDRSLDELEQNPLPLQREIYQLSRSPVGTATSSALTTAAKVTVAATKEAVKAAVPVGQWVVKEGAKAAFSFLSKAVAESAKQQQQQKGGSAGKGQGKKGKEGKKK